MKEHFKESSDLFPENQPVRGNGSELFGNIPVFDKNKKNWLKRNFWNFFPDKSLRDPCGEEIKSLIFCCPSTLRAAEAWLTLVLPGERLCWITLCLVGHSYWLSEFLEYIGLSYSC